MIRPVETKAQRIRRKFGASPIVLSPSINGVNGRRHANGRARRTRTVGDALTNRLNRQFRANWTNCFAATLREINSLPVTTVVERSEDFAKAMFENAKERAAYSLLTWANYKQHGLKLYRQLVLDACEPFTPAPAVDATFVWLYLDSEKQSDELRWSLRSVFANYNGQASPIIFGDRPSWYCGPHVPMSRVGPQPRRRYRDTLNKLHAACTSPLVPDTFVWMMDDTYLLKRVSMRDLSVNRYQGSIPPRPWGNREWRGLQAETYSVLRADGLPLVDYCTHLPKVVEKEKFLEMWERFGLASRVLQWELLYGSCFYENYRPLGKGSKFFGLIRDRSSVAKLRTLTIANNGTRGWSERLRGELWNRFPVQSAVEKSPEVVPNWKTARIQNRRYNYEIRDGYRCRAENNRGISVPDNAQRNVYQFAASIPDVQSVIDWGTGSGAKLVELFADRQTIGVDVAEKVAAARARFPKHNWRVLPSEIDCDLLIVADVIEHLADPIELIKVIDAGRWRHCVISTPERDLARSVNDLGPPKNPRHVREWNTGEFVRFIRKQQLGKIESVRVLGEYNLVVHLLRLDSLPQQPPTDAGDDYCNAGPNAE
jgi:hypothetical protein